jgi:RNA polymerase sigma-70 factor (ECF subfamily)
VDAGAAYRAHASAVLGYLRGRGVADPEDVLGEVFLHVTRSLHRFRGDEEDLRRWIFTIARNRAIDEHRRRSRRPQTDDRDVPDLPVRERSEVIDPDLVAALGRLTPDQREVVALRFVADLSIEDVARITGRSDGAVKSMQLRALAQLARIVDDPDAAVEGDD